MKKLLLSTAALALTAGAAFAADLPSRKAAAYIPPPPPPPMWTGFYAGVNAGYNAGTTSTVNVASAPLVDNVATDLNALNIAAIPTLGSFVPQSYLGWGGTALANTGIAHINQSGFIGGGQVGYNYQLNRFLLGVEADIQGTTSSGTGSYAGAYSDNLRWGNPRSGSFFDLNRSAIGVGTVSARLNWLGTVRGRLGFLVTPTLLVYGTGGFAYGGVSVTSTNAVFGGASLSTDDPFYASFPATTSPGFGNFSGTRTGWTAGGGAEWMFWPNWSLKAEALYYSLASATVKSAVVATAPAVQLPFPAPFNITVYNGGTIANVTSARVGFTGVIARVGVNYHFNWGSAAPVVARY